MPDDDIAQTFDAATLRSESTSDKIRMLAQDGLGTAEIAKRLDIRYQHAYNILASDALSASKQSKPQLTVHALVAGGFVFSGRWVLSNTGDLVLEQPLPKEVGVYAFSKNGIALYVGVATMGIAKRLYFYRKPGISQRTSQRINGTLRDELRTEPHIDIYTATPPDFEWNGLPIQGCVGLELGLIKAYALPWNMRSAG